MDTVVLSLADRLIFEKYKVDMNISDMEFTQLYAWQDIFHNRYQIINDYLCIFYQKSDGSFSCYAPMGEYDKERYCATLLELEHVLHKYGLPFRFDFVSENWLEYLKELPGYQVGITYNEKFSDYIYEAEDFLCLTGKRNENKRYLVHYFHNHVQYEYRSLMEENRDDAYKIANDWCQGRDCQACYWGCEKRAIFKILDAWHELSCKGAVVYVGGLPKAFMIGEQISGDMVVSHFQKADKQIKGLYAFISREFYIREYPQIKYINLQEDMGIPAIREAKMSYRPGYMIHKYTVTLTRKS